MLNLHERLFHVLKFINYIHEKYRNIILTYFSFSVQILVHNNKLLTWYGYIRFT